MESNELLEKFLENTINELKESSRKNSINDYDKAVELILKCENNGGRVHFTGIGKPSHIAGYGASLFSSTGTKSYFLDGTEAIHGSLGQLDKNDVVIAVSNSGNTKELLKTVQAIKESNISLISITGNKNSKIAEIADVSITATTVNEGDNLNKAPRASIINEVFAMQFLSLLLQYKKNIDMETYGKWHPAGSIGESIYGK